MLGGGVRVRAAEVNFPAPSPESTLKQRVGLTDIEIVYSRPGVKGRKIFGGLEPFGSVWRTGANTATKIVFSTPVRFGGQEVPAGAHALYTIPDPSEWTVILSKVSGEWGAYSYNPANDAVRVKAKPVALGELVETFTIELGDVRTESAVLTLSWEKTRVSVPIEVSAVKEVVSQIEVAMKAGRVSSALYYSAAMFYYEHGLDLKQARAWIELATNGEFPPYYMLYGKAKILAKLGERDAAIGAARQSIAAANGAAAAEYKRLNEAVIASLDQ
jgi:hypothetical protein